jgi:Sulfotransferase domain
LIVLAEMMAEMLNPDAVADSDEDSPPEPKETKKFLRKGLVGGWKDEMKPEFAERIDEMTRRKANTEELAAFFAEN